MSSDILQQIHVHIWEGRQAWTKGQLIGQQGCISALEQGS
jgi:hypothetical protein